MRESQKQEPNIVERTLSELIEEIKAVLKVCLFNRTIQKLGGPFIFAAYLSLNFYLYHLYTTVLAPSFEAAWVDSRPRLTNIYLNVGWCLSISCIVVYLVVAFVGPGRNGDAASPVDASVPLCTKCSLPKPARTHHCSVCNRCIPMMDHHCMWTNQCIGRNNRLLFFLLMFVGAAGLWQFNNITVHSNYELFCHIDGYVVPNPN